MVSDSMDWCKDHLTFSDTFHIGGTSPEVDMAVMANCNGSIKSDTIAQNLFKTIRSQTFIIADVKARGLKSFISVTLDFLGTGTISEVFQLIGTLR